jgi:hypothetical protein
MQNDLIPMEGQTTYFPLRDRLFPIQERPGPCSGLLSEPTQMPDEGRRSIKRNSTAVSRKREVQAADARWWRRADVHDTVTRSAPAAHVAFSRTPYQVGLLRAPFAHYMLHGMVHDGSPNPVRPVRPGERHVPLARLASVAHRCPS